MVHPSDPRMPDDMSRRDPDLERRRLEAEDRSTGRYIVPIAIAAALAIAVFVSATMMNSSTSDQAAVNNPTIDAPAANTGASSGEAGTATPAPAPSTPAPTENAAPAPTPEAAPSEQPQPQQQP